MNEVFINIKNDKWLNKYFDADFVSIEKLIILIDDLDGEVEHLKDRIKELEEPDEEDFYQKWKDDNLTGDYYGHS